MSNGWRWNRLQRALFADYAALVVASAHMRDEYVRNGAAPASVHVNPLFPSCRVDGAPAGPPAEPNVGFIGRMTPLKGGDVLLRAVAIAQRTLGRSIPLTMVGDGPSRAEWQDLARSLALSATFTGWVAGDARWALMRQMSVVAVPSLWPEPFALVGLEAGALGVPAVAPATGGISEWLRDGVNGIVLPAPISPEPLGGALAALIGDPDRLSRLRTGARQVAMQMPLSAHVDRLERLLMEVAATEPAS
jgi:glycosyltransferase involved in cell wall biosynthesis